MLIISTFGLWLTTVLMCGLLFKCSFEPWHLNMSGKEAWKLAFKDIKFISLWLLLPVQIINIFHVGFFI